MPYCTKCGYEVSEEMGFCPKCGASLKGEKSQIGIAPSAPSGAEKAEKHEKEEKGEKKEKTEKYEKREFGFTGPLIGGLILIFMGLMFYLEITGFLKREAFWPFFFIVIGTIIIIGAVYAAITAARRYPKP